MSRTNKTNERLVTRFVDGEMDPAERTAFEQRMASDADLAAAVREAEADSHAVQSALPHTLSAPAGFSTKVLDHVRRMPSREELIQITTDEETVAEVEHFGRRILVAAAVIFGLSLLFGARLIEEDKGRELHASDLKQQMRQLDDKVKELRRQELELRNR